MYVTCLVAKILGYFLVANILGDMESEDVISDLWDKLPESLSEEILAKLPFSILLSLCSVCKRWRHSILHSHTFPLWNSAHDYHLDFSKGKLMISRVRSRQTWESAYLQVFLGRNELVPKQIWEHVPLHFLGQNEPKLRSVAMTAGGLLCFRTIEAWDFIVCNPLTKCFKGLQIPSESLSITDPDGGSVERIQLTPSSVVGMVVDGDRGHFKLIVGGFLGRDSHAKTSLLYDSRADFWKKTGDFPQGVLNSNAVYRWQPTAHGGNLYFYSAPGLMKVNDRLLKYDVEAEAWSWIPMPPRGPEGGSRTIIQHGGRFLLVAFGPRYGMRFEVKELQAAGFKEIQIAGLNRPFQWLCPDQVIRLPIAHELEVHVHTEDVSLEEYHCNGNQHRIRHRRSYTFREFDSHAQKWELSEEFPAYQMIRPSTLFLKSREVETNNCLIIDPKSSMRDFVHDLVRHLLATRFISR